MTVATRAPDARGPEARSPEPQAPTPGGRAHPRDDAGLLRRGLRLARLTLAYNLVEAAVAITAGLLAGLVSVVGFGLDSGIGAVSAVLVTARLAARVRRGEADERRERTVLRLVAVSFFLLAAYLTVAGVLRLVDGAAPSTSPLAIALLVVSLVVMPLLAEAKRRVGVALDDPLILADAVETRIGVLLSGATLFGLLVFALTGAVWVDVLAGLVVAAFAVHEGREAWQGELVENHHATDAADECDPVAP